MPCPVLVSHPGERPPVLGKEKRNGQSGARIDTNTVWLFQGNAATTSSYTPTRTSHVGWVGATASASTNELRMRDALAIHKRQVHPSTLTMVRPSLKEVLPRLVKGLSSSVPQAWVVYPCDKRRQKATSCIQLAHTRLIVHSSQQQTHTHALSTGKLKATRYGIQSISRATVKRCVQPPQGG